MFVVKALNLRTAPRRCQTVMAVRNRVCIPECVFGLWKVATLVLYIYGNGSGATMPNFNYPSTSCKTYCYRYCQASVSRRQLLMPTVFLFPTSCLLLANRGYNITICYIEALTPGACAVFLCAKR